MKNFFFYFLTFAFFLNHSENVTLQEVFIFKEQKKGERFTMRSISQMNDGLSFITIFRLMFILPNNIKSFNFGKKKSHQICIIISCQQRIVLICCWQTFVLTRVFFFVHSAKFFFFLHYNVHLKMNKMYRFNIEIWQTTNNFQTFFSA